jgi:hypothetical protein
MFLGLAIETDFGQDEQAAARDLAVVAVAHRSERVYKGAPAVASRCAASPEPTRRKENKP